MVNLPTKRSKRWSIVLLAVFFIGSGLNHFVNTGFYMAMMPDYLPAHLELVIISGIFEILGGVGLLFSATRTAAGYGLMLLLLAVFPANIHMAMNPDLFANTAPIWALYVRLPLQFLLMGWIYGVIRPEAIDR